jgi:hypothetical protein
MNFSGRHTRIAHDTLGVQKTGGVSSEDYWDFKPTQRVMTVDGILGTVEAVFDGPWPGAEEYQVVLDDGMGGGSYVASQLSTAAQTTASEHHLASDDYEELGTVLFDRPDPARQVRASLNPASPAEDASDHLAGNSELRRQSALLTPSAGAGGADGADLIRSELRALASGKASVVRDYPASSLLAIANVISDRPQQQVCREVHAGTNVAGVSHVHLAGRNHEVGVGPAVSLDHAWATSGGVGAIPKIAVSEAGSRTGPQPAICLTCASHLAPEAVLDRLPGATAADLGKVDHVCSLATHRFPEKAF